MKTDRWWLQLWPLAIAGALALVAAGALLAPRISQELKVPSDQPKEITAFERANDWIIDVVNMNSDSWEVIGLLIFIIDEDGQPADAKEELQAIWDTYGEGRDIMRMDFAVFREGKWYGVITGSCSAVDNCGFSRIPPIIVPDEIIKWENK